MRSCDRHALSEVERQKFQYKHGLAGLQYAAGAIFGSKSPEKLNGSEKFAMVAGEFERINLRPADKADGGLATVAVCRMQYIAFWIQA
jgi:hypothetical protein